MRNIYREAVRLIGTGTYKVLEIDLTGDVAESDGMVCGGIMRVLIEDDVQSDRQGGDGHESLDCHERRG